MSSAPFPEPTTWQNLAALDAIKKGLWERAMAAKHPASITALGGSTYVPVSQGDPIYMTGYWLNWQTVLNALVPLFLDHTATYDPAAPVYWTLTDWRTAAGLHSTGYRRNETEDWPEDWRDMDDAAYSYGDIAQGDMIGPWLMQDLEWGMSFLKWTDRRVYLASESSDKWPNEPAYKAGDNQSEDFTACQNAADDIVTRYGTFSYNAAGPQPLYYDAYSGVHESFGHYIGFGLRLRTKPFVNAIWDGREHEADVYLKFIISGVISPVFADVDSLGVSENDWLLIENFAASATDEHIGALFGNYSGIPTLPAAVCPVGTGAFNENGIKSNDARWLFKWDFTNETP
jgi:hypothetical protein